MSLFRRTTPQLLAIGPLARLIAQLIVPAIAIIAKTLPAAYAAALQNAKKFGVADGATDAASKGASFLEDEALQVLNLTENDISDDVESVQRLCSTELLFISFPPPTYPRPRPSPPPRPLVTIVVVNEAQ